jgi:DNA-directed RNA polymerase specialized sigma24 family protein
VQKLSIAETVQALGISEASVKTRLSRARLKMRDTLPTSLSSPGCKSGCISKRV